jgi:C4-dicarboxylate-specific signal transduction histidine kinase
LRQLSGHVALAAQQAEIYSALEQAYDDLRQTQQTVMQHERLRALGQMASGIAHDINNAISPVMLYTEILLETESTLSPRSREYLVTTQRAIEDVAHTVSRMREFYRQQETQFIPTTIDLNCLTQQVVDLTRARWNDMPLERGIVIEMRSELEPNLPPVAGVESEIREALTNLVLNAVDAMPDGGTLTFRTRATRVGTSTPQVHVEVRDTGIGMDEETRRRCLEPFFTTKGIGEGTGMGLDTVSYCLVMEELGRADSSVRGIVSVNNGDVDPSEKEGGSLGIKIPRLSNFLASLRQEEIKQLQRSGIDPAKAPAPELLIIADRTIPYRLLIEVMFSAKAKEAGYKHFRLIVQKNFPVKPPK